MGQKIEAVKGKSPYAKKGKVPFRYSENYERWSAALERHGRYAEETVAADAAFRRQFGVPTWGLGSQVEGSIA